MKTEAKKPPAKERLLFQWPSGHHLHVVLPAMLLVSFALHLGSLAAFQIIYPEPSPTAFHPAEVTTIPRDSGEAEAFYAWLEAVDPALFSHYQPDRAEGFRLPTIRYQPSFDTEKPDIQLPPAELPRVVPDRRIYEFLADLQAGLVGSPARDILQPPAPETRVVGTGELAAMDWNLPQAPVLRRPLTELPRPTVYRVAVGPGGRVRHAFPQQSSGSEQLDQLALKSLFDRLQSAPPEAPVWGEVWFMWGPDVFQPEPRPES